MKQVSLEPQMYTDANGSVRLFSPLLTDDQYREMVERVVGIGQELGVIQVEKLLRTVDVRIVLLEEMMFDAERGELEGLRRKYDALTHLHRIAKAALDFKQAIIGITGEPATTSLSHGVRRKR